tara:strand:+ start:161 stop:385 length:225 start_codon:yes stop_codon:yes gene_type:complete
MKYFILPIILILTSCSLDKNSSFWSEDSSIKSFKEKKKTKLISKNKDIKNMTFEEFDTFLKKYSNNAKYPDIKD